jgi:hypothetical protein
MNSLNHKILVTEELPDNCKITLEELINKLEKLLQVQRDVMYSDILNIIIREGYYGDLYNRLIIWCNYNIKNGKYFVKNFSKIKIYDKNFFVYKILTFSNLNSFYAVVLCI